MTILGNRYVVIDFETTGNSPMKDRVIQVGAVLIEDDKIVERFSSYVNPQLPIPPFVQQLTGISDEDVQKAPIFDDIAPDLWKLLDGSYFVAHNVPFDLAFLQEELANSGYLEFKGPSIDTVELSRMLLPHIESYKLNQLAEYLDIEHENPHRADSDAEVTARLLLFLLNKINTLPLLTLQNLEPLVRQLKSDVEGIFRAEIQAKLKSLLKEEDNVDLFRQFAFKKQIELKEDYSSVPSFQDLKESILQTLSSSMKYYEARKGQVEMMDAVDEALDAHQHLLVEAGTGTGKSLAYLLPSIVYGKKEGRPMVISTHTVQLQEQLLDRDIPLLNELLPFELNAAVLKGRNHYLCMRKFEQHLSQTVEQNYDTILTKAQLLVWLVETDFGDVEELNLPSGGKLLWEDVKSDVRSCLNHKCPFFSRCFYHRAKRKAQQADVVITNHSLLFTDLVNRNQLLPAYKEVVIDEAHHLEEVGGNYFGVQTDYFSFHQLLDRIGDSADNGLFSKAAKLCEEIESSISKADIKRIDEALKNVLVEGSDLFRMLHTFVSRKHKKSPTEIGRVSLRIDEEIEKNKLWASILETTARVTSQLKDLANLLSEVNKALREKEEHLSLKQSGLLVDYEGMIQTVLEQHDKLDYLLLNRHVDEVMWLEAEIKGPRNAVYIFSKPIEIADKLADSFFSKKNSVVLTSATLTVNENFDYIIEHLGLEDFVPITKTIPSPFHYENQAKLMIPTDFPLIKDVKQEEFVEEAAQSIYQIANVTNGRMLVLFTSYEMLRAVYKRVKELTEKFILIGQGVDSGSRAKLTKNFKQFDKAILFGTSSFWEGVDIPGEDLSCLVIVRLPFSPPDHPILAAKSEKLANNGGNPFMDLSLPQAVIRFKQGFGRLVRTQSDRGVVFVLDRRIISTRYGKMFRQSLPAVPIMKGPLYELLDELRGWL
ncbi:ATP-dependent DNA helicase DinG [Bacillus taeanensis]|uniref:ATP-dependent DNA helicase DinG n=1 Tax=Bacillus taeanensis TaxID=273032 RepID=UPI001FEABC5E|nr:ATP-dependent DNA helicase DinG [Bacillus taeanensis]